MVRFKQTPADLGYNCPLNQRSPTIVEQMEKAAPSHPVKMKAAGVILSTSPK